MIRGRRVAGSVIVSAMRCFAGLVALMALGCSTSWQRIPMSSIKNNDAELLFVVTTTKAYVLVGSRYEADIVHGVPQQEWDLGPSAPIPPELTDEPEHLAKRLRWTEVAPHNGDVKIPFHDIRYSSAGDPPSGEAQRTILFVIVLVASGAIFIPLLAFKGFP